ncbi:hypothetical protein FB45DRAFT_913186 [Roridomyces roridus]|uniref:Autophagy-related protein 2 n=1 Tax=Roridomyces roridus TaxID=1738132 RepID=A0AAD7FMF4_9AGAR|nr:hypothetical protein FB45DRAFT_913186 [Roridomyces roridus]
MSWYSNWLPTSLPSLGFALPSRFISFDIQRTFISFVLKKSLGHLLKPGQLDIQQIDSQLGSGYVQVNNVELDNEAINNALVGLPIKLYEGTISSVTARVPWPNPLTSTVGLSIDSLQLTFHVLPLSEHARSVPNLAESVASVADSFIHELSPREEASLRESFHPDLASSTHSIDDHNVPGGLDPFISAPEEEEAFSGDADPPGISIFATLIERLLARFEFNAANTNITLVHPDHTDFTVCIPEIVYCTEQRPDGDDVGSALGATRMVTISGLSITATDCRPARPTSHTPTSSVSKPSSSLTYMDSPRRTHSPEPEPRSASPASSSSSLDDDAQFAMSQSLAFLPPRSASPASSVASSMYQSAISDTETRGRSTPSPGTQQPAVTVTVPPTVPPSQETLKPTPSAEVIFSIGAEPIVIRLEMQTSDPNDVRRGDGAVADDIKLSVDIGLIACALRAWHIKGVTEMLDIMTGSLPSDSSHSPPNPSAKQAMALTLRARLRGAVLLLLPAEEHSMSIFFSRPLVPPKLPHSYLRIHLETMSALMASPQSRTTSSEADTFTFSLSDISAFVFRASDPGQDAALSASPLLITDHHLHIQYSPSHLHPDSVVQHDLPAFALIDWTDASHQLAGMKVSHWKTKVAPKHGKSARRASQVDAAIPPSGSPSASALPPAVMLTGKRSMSKHNLSSTIVDIVVEPLHVFLDLDFATSRVLLTFLDEINNGSGGPSKEDSEQITPPASPQLRRPPGAKERQRQRLENMVLEDLDLDFDYRSDISDKNRRPRAKARSPTTTVNVKSQMIRVQVRCPPPSGHSVRSGALVLDIHDINVSLGSAPKKSKARFDSQHEADPLAVQPMLSAGFRRILVACCAAGEGKASAFLSVGPLGGSEDTEFPVLLPKITLSKSAPRGSRDSGPATIALAVQIPSVYAHLSKPLFDSLQYLADDVAQLMENVFGSGNGGGEKVESRDGSLIGSRFFAKSRSGSGSGLSTGSDPPKSQSVIKLEVTEAFVRVMLPRTSTTIRPFDITASDLGISVQVKPEGKDETVVGVTAMGLDVKNTNTTAETLLSLTTPRGLASAAKPLVNLAFTSLVVPETAAKESRIKLSLWGFTCSVSPDVQWANDLALFFKPPPGAFEAVVPSERTLISLKVTDGSIRVRSSIHPGALVVHAGALDFHTSVVGDTPDSSFHISVQQLAVLMIDDLADAIDPGVHHSGTQRWRKSGFALLTEVSDLDLAFKKSPASPSLETLVVIERVGLQLHLCADSLSAVADFSKDLAVSFNPPSEEDLIPKPKPAPAVVSPPISHESLMASVDDLAFKRVPEVGPPPDMINDDLPTNMEYLDESFGAAAGMRELLEEDLEESDVDDDIDAEGAPEIVSKVGGETIKILRPEGLNIVEHYFDNLPPDTSDGSLNLGASTTRVRVHKGDIKLFLYDGYDWKKTRRTIEEEIKEMRRRLAKIRQLVAGGQTQETGFEEVNTVLFNSVYIGLEQDIDELEPTALIAAIDEELKDDLDTTSQSSWQSLKSPSGAAPQARSSKTRGKRLTRSKTPSIEFQLMGVEAEVDQFRPDEPVAGRTFFTVKDLAILDHIKTSTWKKFLTDLRSDARGNVRETDSNMVRVELRSVRPTPGHPSEEARLRAKILPLRLYVDQDALDFLKKFFSFKDPHSPASTVEADSDGDIYFQLVEVFPVDLKLDYKPRRVDYRALKEGKTIELMNFFHFDGAEMTLRHITMAGVTGWPRMFDMLNDLWTPDVKATQLVDVISGVAPIRSVVNVGSGVADLVLLPIAQYKKDGRIVRGVQKGTTAFFKSTAVEAIKLGARLATGTQVILEQAEDVLGGQFKNPVTTEAVQPGQYGSDEDEEPDDLISKYAEQPVDLREGMQSAYHSLRRNLNSAAQTILAVPMEVYERSGNEGPVRSVIRAVPIAVLKPMIGASEAVSKTLLGLHNTLDPNVRHENEAKYKHR